MQNETIVYITPDIASMEDIYELFRRSDCVDIPSNLDALEDSLSDIPHLHIIIDDISHFRTIFDTKMTKKYFWKRYERDMGPFSEMLFQIFEPYFG